jgi:hypothetical protein
VATQCIAVTVQRSAEASQGRAVTVRSIAVAAQAIAEAPQRVAEAEHRSAEVLQNNAEVVQPCVEGQMQAAIILPLLAMTPAAAGIPVRIQSEFLRHPIPRGMVFEIGHPRA